MHIVKISEDTLKIIIGSKDFEGLGVSFEKLESDKSSARSFINKIINIVNADEKFSDFFCETKVYVEIYENVYFGYVVYLTKRGLTQKEKFSTVMIEFCSVSALIKGTKEIFNELSQTVKSSDLYYKDKKYRLILKFSSISKQAYFSLLDISKQVSTNKIKIEKTKEHYQLLKTNNALKFIYENV